MPPTTPLLRPGRFFAERDFHALRLLLVASLLVLSLPAAVWSIGWVLRERVDGTVLVDNPDRPSERWCRNAPESMAEGCDAPARIEQDIDVVLSEAVGEFMGPAIFGVFIAVLLAGGLLHGGSWMLDGENGVPESFAVALWGLVPTLFGLVASVALLAAVIEPTTVTPDTDPAAFADRLRAALDPLERWGPVVTGMTSLWSGYIWRSGLVHERGLTAGEATGVAGSVAVLLWLISLL